MKHFLKNLLILCTALVYLTPTFEQNIVLAQENDESLKDIFSEFSLKSLLDVRIVSVSKKEETVFEAPLSSTVLTAEEIKNAGATSLMEAFRLIPGMIVREQTPGNYDIHIRGFDQVDPYQPHFTRFNTITLVMIDNRPVYNDLLGGTLWDLIPVGINDIERIEVVRGPSSALYGPNAALGVINIITKKHNLEPGVHASTYTQLGSYNTYLSNSDVSFTTDDKQLSFSVSAKYDNRDRHKVNFYTFPDVVGKIMGDPNYFKGGYSDVPDNIVGGTPVPANNELFPDYDLATDKYAIVARGEFSNEEFSANLSGGIVESKIQHPYLAPSSWALTNEENDHSFLHLFGKWNNLSYNTDYTWMTNKTIGVLDYSYRSWNATIDYNFILNESLSFKPGLAVHQSTIISNKAVEYVSTDPIVDLAAFEDGTGTEETNTFISAFARLEYYYKRMRFVAAGRVEKYEYPDRYFFSPQLIATFMPSDDLLLRASYGRSGRAPFLTSLFVNLKPSDYLGAQFISNPDKEELLTVDVFEVGMRYNQSDQFYVDLELFYSHAQDFEQVLVNNFITEMVLPVFEYVNASQKANLYGATALFKYIPSENLSFTGFVTVQETKVNEYDYRQFGLPTLPNNVSDSSFTAQWTPSYYGGLNINYKPMNKVSLNVNGYFYDSQVLTLAEASLKTFEVDANFLLNAGITYTPIPEVQLFLNGRNLLGGGKVQYGFADEIKPMVLFGMNASI